MKKIYTLFLICFTFVSISNGQSYNTGFPAVTNIAQTTATIETNITVNGYYTSYVILEASAPAPTIQNVLDWTLDGNGGILPSGTYGDITIPGRGGANNTFTGSVTNLSAGTDYIAYIATSVDWTEATAIEIGSPTSIPFSTQDVPPPGYNSGYPTVSNIAESSVTVITNLNTNGYYTSFVILESTAPKPTLQNVLDWSYDGNGGTLPVGTYGDIDVTGRNDANTDKTFDASNLQAATSYIVYCATSIDWTLATVIESSNPTEIAFATTGVEAPSLSPTNGATDVSRQPTLTATFSNTVSFMDGTIITVFQTASPATNPINLNTGTAPFYGNRDARLSVVGTNFTIDLSDDVLEGTTNYGVYVPSNSLLINGTPYNGFSNIGSPGWAFTTAADLPAPIGVYDPVDQATGVSIQKTLQITFDRDIQENQSATPTYVRLYQSGQGTPIIECLIDNGVIQPGQGVSIAGNILSINPASDLEIDTDYYLTIDAGAVESMQGAPFAGIDNTSTFWRFRTEVPPVITTYDPLEDATEVAIDKTIQLTFDKNIAANPGTAFYYIRIRDAADDSEFLSIYARNGAFESGKGASITNNVLTIDPPSSFEASKTYYLDIEYGAIHGVDGTIFTGIDNSPTNNYQFSTVTNPPAVSSYDPLQDATEIAHNKALALTFDKAVRFNSTLSNRYIYIYDAASPGVPIFQSIVQNGAPNNPAEVYLSNGDLTLNINPAVDFNLNTNYYVVIDAGAVEALSGDPFPGIDNSVSNNWRFTTATPPIWTNGYPYTQGLTDISVDFVGQTNKNGNYYYVITNSATAPSEAQIEAGTDENDAPALISGNGGMTAITDFIASNIDISILSISTTHYIYVVSKESSYNQYSTVEQLTFVRNVVNTWTGGAGDSDYTNPANWSGAYVNQGSLLIQASAAPNFPLMNDIIDVYNVEVEAGAQLTIGSSGNVTVNGTLDLYSSTTQNASLITNGTFTVSPSNVRVHQRVTANDRTYYVSPAVSGATRNSIGADIGMFYWDNSIGDYVASNPAAAMVSANGYALRSNNDLVFTGGLHNGTQQATVYRSTNGLGWNLIGNPFPSSVDWTSPNITKSDIVDAFWVYLNDQSQYGAYNASIGVAINIENPLIPSNHAIWVKVNEGDADNTGYITFTNGARVHNNTSYLKSAKLSSNPTFKIAGVNGSLRDEMAVAFNASATNDIDIYDSEKKFADENTNYFECYTKTGTTELCINSLPNYINSVSIPLCFRSPGSGTYTIENTDYSNFPVDHTVELEDLDPVQGKIIDLVADGGYTFTTTQTGDIEDRFVLHFKNAVATNVEPDIHSALTKIYAADKVIKIDIPDLEQPRYELYDMNGRLLKQGRLDSNSTNTVVTAIKGIVIVKVIHASGVESQKVILK
jgi:hypothetical protein